MATPPVPAPPPEGEAPPTPPEPFRPPADDRELLRQCRVDTFRSGGPGGQHQNVTESGVRLTHLPTGEVVSCRSARSQHRNRKLALARLRERLAARTAPRRIRGSTRIPARERARRLEAKRRRSALKHRRKPPDPKE